MKSLYALHKDKAGAVLGAHSFSSDYDLSAWVRSKWSDLRHGDSFEFGEAVNRPEFDEVETPKATFRAEAPAPVPADEDLTF